MKIFNKFKLILTFSCKSLCVNLVGMCTYETDIHDTIGIVDPYDNPVFIACYIKNDSAIFENTGISEICFNFCG